MSWLATRDQENFIHNQRTVAAAKPLNQGVRGLAQKTPSNNGLNKSIVNANKSVRGLRGDENAAPAAKTAKGAKAAFVTPIGELNDGEIIRCNSKLTRVDSTSRPCTIGCKDDQLQSQSISDTGSTCIGQWLAKDTAAVGERTKGKAENSSASNHSSGSSTAAR